MRTTLRALALAVSAAYLVAALTPCAPVRPASAEARSVGPRASIELAHATHADHGATALASHGRGDGPASAPVLQAICPCGCGKRPAAAGAPGALGYALLLSPDRWIDPAGDAPLASPRATLPGVAPRAIDHVPLTAV